LGTIIKNTNLLGAAVTEVFYISAILIFVLRLLGKPQIGYWIGVFELFLALPLIFLLVKAPELNRPILYYIQIGLMLAWLVIELFLDYILKIDFRQVQWMVIAYVTLFFAGTGGMLGIAANAGRAWSMVSVVLFLVMAVLAFVQRGVTGM
jgi:hypothetical protein